MIALVLAQAAGLWRTNRKMRLTPAMFMGMLVGIFGVVALGRSGDQFSAMHTVVGVVMGFVFSTLGTGRVEAGQRRNWPLLPAPDGVRRFAQVFVPVVFGVGPLALLLPIVSFALDAMSPVPREPFADYVVTSLRDTSLPIVLAALGAAFFGSRTPALPKGARGERWMGWGVCALLVTPLVCVVLDHGTWGAWAVALIGLLLGVVPIPDGRSSAHAGALGAEPMSPSLAIAILVLRTGGLTWLAITALALGLSLVSGDGEPASVPPAFLPVVASLAAIASSAILPSAWRRHRRVADWIPVDPRRAWYVATAINAGIGTVLALMSGVGSRSEVLFAIGAPLSGVLAVTPAAWWGQTRAALGVVTYVGWMFWGLIAMNPDLRPVLPVLVWDATLGGLLATTLAVSFGPSPRRR